MTLTCSETNSPCDHYLDCEFWSDCGRRVEKFFPFADPEGMKLDDLKFLMYVIETSMQPLGLLHSREIRRLYRLANETPEPGSIADGLWFVAKEHAEEILELVRKSRKLLGGM